MTALLLIGSALAADLALSGGVVGSFGAGSDAGRGGLGHELTLETRVTPRFFAQVMSTSSVGASLDHFTAMAGPRLYLSDPWSGAAALSLDLGLGVDLFGPALAAQIGGSVDLPSRRRLVPRVSAGFELAPDAEGVHPRGRLALTVLMPRPLEKAAPTPVVEAPPKPPPAPPRVPLELEAAPEEARVWVPHPICAWVPASQAAALLAQLDNPLPPDAMLDVIAEGYLPEHVPAQGEQKVALKLSENRGALIVLAHPGDQVSVGGAPVPVNGDGIAMLNAPEGRVAIEVRAGGQRQEYKAALSSGYAVWIRVKPPAPTQILFPQGSSELSAAAAQRIQGMAADAAGWSFVLQGAYSYEGSLNVNNRLARERGQNVGAALLAAGVPADHIAYLDPPPADPNKDPTTQRACNILAVPPERGQ